MKQSVRAARRGCQATGAPFLLFLSATLLASGCDAPPPASLPLDTPSAQEVELEGLRFERWTRDALEVRASAERARLDRQRHLAHATPLVVELSLRSRSNATVSADQGAADLAAGTLELEGHVLARDLAGRELRTDRASYDSGRKLLIAPGTVHLSGRNFKATGPSLRADLTAEVLEVPGEVRGQVDGADVERGRRKR